MPHTTVTMSRYRTAQFRDALHRHGLDSSADAVWRVHEFDSVLRSVTLAMVERVELALRGRVDDAASTRFGPRWYLTDRAFRTTFDHRGLLVRLRSALDRTADPAVASAWRAARFERVTFGMLVEERSLGELSRLTAGLEPRTHDAVAAGFRVPPATLDGSLQHLTHVRNCCAHHTRLWGRRFKVPPPTFRSPPDLVARLRDLPKRSPAHALELLAHLAESVGPCGRHAAAVARLDDEHDDLVVGIGGRPSWAAA